MTALALRDVTAGYGKTPAVREVSATVAAGGWLAIVGPNGAGKSTLLKAIAGIVACTGTVELAGTPTSRLSRKALAREVGYAPQNPVLPDGLTVTDYVLLGRTPHLSPLARESAADVSVVDETLKRLDLAELAGRRLATLSGGEQQRTVLARVLAQRTNLLLLDEPTTGLDVGHAQALLERLDRLRREDGTTVVTTLHDLTFAAQYADTLLLLDHGVTAAAGKPKDVLTPERLSTHYAADTEVLLTAEGHPVVAPIRRSPRHGAGLDAGGTAPPARE